jgi:hypothetical protein
MENWKKESNYGNWGHERQESRLGRRLGRRGKPWRASPAGFGGSHPMCIEIIDDDAHEHE